MTLEIIQAKRAALLAECERAKGAIQALDDLIAEVAADRERRKELEAEAYDRAREDALFEMDIPRDVPIDWSKVPHYPVWIDAADAVPLASESPPMSPPSPPEMFGREPAQ